MRDQTFERLTSRQLVGIDRFSPGVLLPVAFLCGALAQWLFYGVPLGVNLALAVIGMLILCWTLRPAGARVDALDRWVVPVAVIFAFLPTLRSDLMLLLFDVPAMLVLVGMAAVCFAGVPVTRRALDLLVVLGLVVAGRIVSGGAVLLAALPELGRPLTRRAGGRIASIGIGLALALPFLVVFGALFASADAVFSSALRNAFDLKRWSIGEVIGRTALAFACGWVAGGVFLVAGRPSVPAFSPVIPRLRGLVSSTAATTMLVAVDALFLFFVSLQIAYLFGGLDTLNATGLTYSEYARRGFFELIAAGLVVGGLIFGVELVVARRSRPYVLAALTLVLATLVVVGSAAYRMHLYQLAYGWTEQRFYALAGIAWLGAGGAVAIACIARDATRWLVHAGGVLGLGVAVAINVLGPTGFVARQNLERVAAGAALPADAYRGLDVAYLVSLGDGAIPTLVEYLPRIDPRSRELLGSYLRTYALEPRDLGAPAWQGLSADRERARAALIGSLEELRGFPLYCPPFGACPRR